ncbi:MAG TPA: GTPase Era [Rectinema sp.]|jgi:GTP-binding protein Era|nr:GTPase Era [Spirochaetia bacterium]OQC75262.1 MAG: GTPase Era [Spirochaetes bacterium ADurb.Bin001]HNP93165.1 GTPase Era [Rectinema sp.]HNV35711.1 GTPase Era [Rectinema sp.]HNZ93152.1 GTPase Era [Rectinema sp.]
MPKSAFVAIIGRPSVGKSTLLNALCGAKVSIVSSVPQTTRNAIRGIITRPEGQLIFVDTPGYHISDKKLNLRLREIVLRSLSEVDLILYLIDATREPGKEEEAIAELLSKDIHRIVVAINKIDDPEARPLLIEEFIIPRLRGAKRVSISAVEKTNLESLIEVLFSLAPEGPFWYPEDIYTDQEPVFRIGELVREKAILNTYQELPHAIAVEYRESSKRADGVLFARFDILVERDSQKAIVIGRQGSIIKRIREEAEADLKELFDYPIKLQLQVRVDPDWRKSDSALSRIIF